MNAAPRGSGVMRPRKVRRERVREVREGGGGNGETQNIVLDELNRPQQGKSGRAKSGLSEGLNGKDANGDARTFELGVGRGWGGGGGLQGKSKRW